MISTLFFRALTLVAALSFASAMMQAQGEPLPLDPLTAGERAVADTIARADPRVREFLGRGPSRLINVDFIGVKHVADTAQRGEVPPRRNAEALFYRSDRDQGLRVLVDLVGRQVADIAAVPGPSVPLSGDEVALAARLALADSRVVRLFGGELPAFRVATGPATRSGADSARIEGLRTVGATPRDPCYRRRCVVLFFRVGNRYVQMNRVVVDLTRQLVIVRESD